MKTISISVVLLVFSSCSKEIIKDSVYNSAKYKNCQNIINHTDKVACERAYERY